MRAIRQSRRSSKLPPECSRQSKLMALAINFNVGAHQIVFLRLDPGGRRRQGEFGLDPVGMDAKMFGRRKSLFLKHRAMEWQNGCYSFDLKFPQGASGPMKRFLTAGSEDDEFCKQ